jgi:hypothetical protein
MSFAFELTNG